MVLVTTVIAIFKCEGISNQVEIPLLSANQIADISQVVVYSKSHYYQNEAHIFCFQLILEQHLLLSRVTAKDVVIKPIHRVDKPRLYRY